MSGAARHGSLAQTITDGDLGDERIAKKIPNSVLRRK
jgi:hypothetical protein